MSEEKRLSVAQCCVRCKLEFFPFVAGAKYCSNKCKMLALNKAKRRQEGWHKSHTGYIMGYVWRGEKRIRISQHRHLVEVSLGRTLKSGEHVHHINGVRDDNRLENLQVMDGKAHISMHSKKRGSGYKLKLTEEQRRQRSLSAKAKWARLKSAGFVQRRDSLTKRFA